MAGAIILAVGTARATSPPLPVTPATIGHQRLLAVTVSVTGTKRREQFRVIVKPRVGVPYYFSQPGGGLEDDRLVGQGRAFPCPVTTTKREDGATVYRFTLPVRYLAHARFEFGYVGYNDGHISMPDADLYWFKPAAFVHHKASRRKRVKASA